MDSAVFSELNSVDLATTDDAKTAAMKASEGIDVEALNRASRQRKRKQDAERTEKLAEAWRQREIERKG